MVKIDAMLTAIEQRTDSFQSQARQLLDEMRESKREDSKEKQNKQTLKENPKDCKH